MTNLQLYLNDQLVDLSDDSPIALTFQINNLAEVKNQQGNTSNQFKLPLTQNNRRILGFPDEIAFTDAKPYHQYTAKIIQNGLEIIPYGIGELNGIENDTAAITILSGNVDFFDAIDGKIYDMGDSTTALTSTGAKLLWKPFDHYWDLRTVTASQTKTDGWIWPVIDHGKVPESFDDTPTIDVRQLRPGFFLKTAIELMAAQVGYKIEPESFLVKDELYQKLIVQFANDSFEHGTDYQNGKNDPLSCTVKTGIDMQFGTVNEYAGRLPFNSKVNDPGNLWQGGDNSYLAPGGVSATATLSFSATVYGNPSKHNKAGETMGLLLLLKMYNAGGNVELTRAYVDLSTNARELFPGYYQFDANNIKVSADIDLGKDDHIYVDYYVTSNKNGGRVILHAGATLSITSKKQNVLYGQQIQCERIFPDISMKDLLKDTLQRFGIICQTNSIARTIRLASFRDIVNNIPSARNWTTRCLDQGKSISFQLGGYAQVNYLKYKEDDNVLPKTLGQSQINVADTTLAPTADLFQSQFAATLNRPYIGGSIAQIKKMGEDSTDFSISTQPRILIDDKLQLNGRTIKFTDGSADIIINDTISVPYFDKTNGRYSLTFESLRNTYYPELQKILTESKKVVRYFMLSPRDILDLDLLIPVYLQQDGAYYYINKIDSWRNGQPVKVELVRL